MKPEYRRRFVHQCMLGILLVVVLLTLTLWLDYAYMGLTLMAGICIASSLHGVYKFFKTL